MAMPGSSGWPGFVRMLRCRWHFAGRIIWGRFLCGAASRAVLHTAVSAIDRTRDNSLRRTAVRCAWERTVQLPFRTSSSVDAYIRNREWRDARLPCCPLHPSGGCLFARHGSYPRRMPRGLRIARWYCPEGRRTFSLLPDFLAARLPSLLVSIEESVTVASAVKSVEAAADALRGLDVTLPSAVRWLRRRIRGVRTALMHVSTAVAIGAFGNEPTPGIALPEGSMLLCLRRSLSPQMLSSIPPPLGFNSASGVGPPRGSSGQQRTGPDGPIAGLYGPAVDGDQAGWHKRSHHVLPKPRPPPRICSGSGAPIAACGTAPPAFTCNGSSGSALIARDTGSRNAPN
jgi:hypothetical protein